MKTKPVYDVARDSRGWYATRYGERVSDYVRTRREAETETTQRMVSDLRVEDNTGIRATPLIRDGYRPCDIPACNCGSLHKM